MAQQAGSGFQDTKRGGGNVFLEKRTISGECAKQLIAAAGEKAKELQIAVNIAVADDGGNLIGFLRMDNAPLLSIEIAQNKAYTAAAFGFPTHEWYPMIEKHPALKVGIVHTPRLVVFGGGYPIFSEGKLAGGIGVSGGSEEQDQLCCLAALALLGDRQER
ncbi:GlcG/HbpS family heme-binding protein [Brevibacillus fluminis]|uniref:GlcG/HbpS family heme-binding protein n=1 Tax=Brevibacillus fluminis TaxID=511487 RepID=UPI003F896CD9